MKYFMGCREYSRELITHKTNNSLLLRLYRGLFIPPRMRYFGEITKIKSEKSQLEKKLFYCEILELPLFP